MIGRKTGQKADEKKHENRADDHRLFLFPGNVRRTVFGKPAEAEVSGPGKPRTSDFTGARVQRAQLFVRGMQWGGSPVAGVQGEQLLIWLRAKHLSGSRAAALPSGRRPDMMLCVISYWVLTGAKTAVQQQAASPFLKNRMSGERRNLPVKMTRHNGRSGKNGVYNPKHNDRSFDVANSNHIDENRVIRNVYWDCYQGLHSDPEKQYESFAEIEQRFYFAFYHESVEAQNQRNIRNRHPERNRTTDDLLADKRTCPEESILQLGTMGNSVEPEVLGKVALEFFQRMDERFGDHIHFLDWSLHLDEGTPHIHERHVFDCEDAQGLRKPQQEKALEAMGIELPDPSKPKGKNNNRKMTFDKICRDLLFEICEEYKLHPDREPSYGGRGYMEKQEYIIHAQQERLAETEAVLEEATIRLQDVEAIVEEVSNAAYEKACEVVTETVRAETVKADLDVIADYKEMLTAPGSKNSPTVKSVVTQVLDGVQKKIRSAAQTVLAKVAARLQSPEVRKANTEEIKGVARRSLRERLREKQTESAARPAGPKKKLNKEQSL